MSQSHGLTHGPSLSHGRPLRKGAEGRPPNLMPWRTHRRSPWYRVGPIDPEATGLGMRRREFITLLSGAAAVRPLAARAQQAAMPVIGILIGGTAESFAPFEPAFRKGLIEGGFSDGSNVPFESRRADGQVDRLPGLAADDRSEADRHCHADVVRRVGGEGCDQHDTCSLRDRRGPGQNRAGGEFQPAWRQRHRHTIFMNVLGAKRLELVSEAVPTAMVLGLLVNPTNPNAEADTRDLKAPAQALGRRGLSLERSISQRPRVFIRSKATCAAPSCEVLTPCRGLRPHHVQKDRIGTWDISCLAVTC